MLRRRPDLARPSVAALTAVVAAVAALTACPKKPSGPPPPPPAASGLPVKSATAARADLLGTVIVPSLDRSIASVLALVKKADPSYPVQDPKQLRQMMMTGARVPPAVAASVRTDRPLALVMMSGGVGKPPMAVAAVEMASPQAVKQAIAAVGAPSDKRADAVAIKTSDASTLWMWPKGNVLVVAETVDGLIAGASLALDARSGAAGADDLVATAHLDAIARSQGTDLPTALKKAGDAAREGMKTAAAIAAAGRGKPPAPPSDEMAMAMVDLVFARVADTGSADFTTRIDPSGGVTLGLRLHPRAGSAFERSVKTPAPYAIDPALLAAGQPAALWATGPGPLALQAAEIMKGRFAASPDKATAALAASCDTVLGALSGASSGSIRFDGSRLAYQIVYPLKSGADGSKVIDAVAAIGGSKAMADFIAAVYGPIAPKVAFKREGSTLRATVGLGLKPSKSGGKEVGALVKKLFGSDKLEILMTVGNGRLVGLLGAGGKPRLAALADGRGGPPPAGDLGAALAETRGHDGLGYLDLGAFVAPVMAAFGGAGAGFLPAGLGGSPGGKPRPMPLFVSWRGGDAFVAELRVPVTSIATGGALAKSSMAGIAGGSAR